MERKRGELFILLRKLVEEDGTTFDEDDIRKGFNYVKDHRSMHRWHEVRASLFDRAGKVNKEKKFVKVLAWRMGQLSKLYMLRKANIKIVVNKVPRIVGDLERITADMNTPSVAQFAREWEQQRQSMSEEMNQLWANLKKTMAKKVDDIINKASDQDSPIENEDDNVERALPLEAINLQN
uniref:Uncharacterized protein n=1 Tax=Globodera pallida TaxID=36090 RepID=A0A183BTR6_GLOPA